MTFTSSQRYCSTRGAEVNCTFEHVLFKGLASDGGLYIPHEIPRLPHDWQAKWSSLTFVEIAVEIFSLYIDSTEIDRLDLHRILTESYSTFRSPNITPLINISQPQRLYVLELFHGPSYSFKDVALQVLGNLFEFFLQRRNKDKNPDQRFHLTVLGATSGDTGSAAIYGLRGKADISIFILHPQGKISPIQLAQMATIPDSNVHNLAIQGSFDDCQNIVKMLFVDKEINSVLHLAAVNSINWARILAQITYYFVAYFTLYREGGLTKDTRLNFVVPTGNFGDILAGWFARKMGLPITLLTIATNKNDGLVRFFKNNGCFRQMPLSGPFQTYAPAMDVVVSSNFERVLWWYMFEAAQNGQVSGAEDIPNISSEQERNEKCREIASRWISTRYSILLSTALLGPLEKAAFKLAEEDFKAASVTDEEIVKTIRRVFTEYRRLTSGDDDAVIIDPHTAVGVKVALDKLATGEVEETIVCLATAHPAKFMEVMELALKDVPDLDLRAKIWPDEFSRIENAEQRVIIVEQTDNGYNEEKVKQILMRQVKQDTGVH